MTRRARIAIVAAVILAIQVVAVLVYWQVERSRGSGSRGTFAAEALTRRELAPSLAIARPDRASVVGWPAPQVRIVHFWGTWCEPCRDELPALLQFGRSLGAHGVEVVAIAVDDRWEDIQTFFAGKVPPEVVLSAEPAGPKRFGVSTLPDTYLVDRTGRLVERFQGARDWSAPAARDHVLGTVAKLGTP